VNIQNWRQVSEGQGGLSEQESEWLERIALATEATAEQTRLTHTLQTVSFGLFAFSFAGLLVLGVRRSG
jgi:hypothetical protein